MCLFSREGGRVQECKTHIEAFERATQLNRELVRDGVFLGPDGRPEPRYAFDEE